MSSSTVGGILYTVIARQDVRLCEYKNDSMPYNPFQVSQATSKLLTTILGRIDPKVDQRRSFKTSTTPELHFHVLVTKGLTVLCMTEATYPKRCAHPYLEEIKAVFLSPQFQNWGSWETAPSHHYNNAVFVRQIAQISEHHSNLDNDKITNLHKHLDEAKNIFLEQIELLIERGEHIDILEDKTRNLANESVTFREKAFRMKMRFCWKNVKLIIVIVALVLVVLFLLVWFACGVPDFRKCAELTSSGTPPSSPPPPHVPTGR